MPDTVSLSDIISDIKMSYCTELDLYWSESDSSFSEEDSSDLFYSEESSSDTLSISSSLSVL